MTLKELLNSGLLKSYEDNEITIRLKKHNHGASFLQHDRIGLYSLTDKEMLKDNGVPYSFREIQADITVNDIMQLEVDHLSNSGALGNGEYDDNMQVYLKTNEFIRHTKHERFEMKVKEIYGEFYRIQYPRSSWKKGDFGKQIGTVKILQKKDRKLITIAEWQTLDEAITALKA